MTRLSSILFAVKDRKSSGCASAYNVSFYEEKLLMRGVKQNLRLLPSTRKLPPQLISVLVKKAHFDCVVQGHAGQ